MTATLVCARCMGTWDVWGRDMQVTAEAITQHLAQVHELHGTSAAEAIMTSATLGAKLVDARRNLAAVTERARGTRDQSEAVTVGGITGYDSAVLSGTMRKASPRKQAARLMAYDREAKAWEVVAASERAIRVIESQIKREHRDKLIPYTEDELRACNRIRTDLGWHRVVRVNKTSVSVETGYSWVDRIPLAKVIEVRKVADA
ncbi:hypothetical protein [Cryobacterium psychrophilum]|uniref:Uncharacterized protein n=1 Tax=Cryobacterium psychrophilum TaxID=41988 RepID=A0A4Y8KQ10_9MICO|nr:hypothetical protein [Cryobacterium psychrophilum]TDW31006.1 hypothetical protein EDD25_2794 [Cryobacterium psychrophilum]TFD80864.1 hypothetical protein E3T53_04370 [Cryobacterium psychrophilum]